MARGKVLLIGNGINNIEEQYKWGNLVDDLIEFVGGTGQIGTNDKPFPLLYEEVFAYGVKKRGLKELQIKNYIAERIARFRPNEVHKRIVNMRGKNILTTNYDYNLEMATGVQDQNALRNSGVVQEDLYSLFRFAPAREKRVWHIHGERNSPQSIALGYEHYGGYLQRMRNYVVMGTGDTYKRRFASLESRLRTGAVTFDSWVDFFFTHDIYVVGLSLDFIEIHLWWLLTYRARRKYTKLAPIRNQITYFYPNSMKSEIRSKLDLLRANDVVLSPVILKSDDWGSYYNRVLEMVETTR